MENCNSVNYMKTLNKEFDFNKCVAEITKGKELKSGSPFPCPDQYFADLIVPKMDTGLFNVKVEKRNFRSNIRYNENGIAYWKDKNDKKGIIVIVLESPHKNEFKKDGTPIGPAMGITGAHFLRDRRGFIDYGKEIVFKESPEGFSLSGEYQLIYVNSVQYQTSLGRPLSKEWKKCRDAIWLSIFDDQNGKKDFKKRIDALKPDLVINLCTKGLKENFNLKVEKEISNDYPYVYGYHPSTWNFNYACINGRRRE